MAESKTAKKLTQVSTGLTKGLALFVQGRIASDLLFLVKERVTASGVSASGKPFTQYSIQYGKKRQTAGYQISYKDFMIKGTMWAGVKVLSVKSRGNIVELIYGGTDELTRQKLRGHGQREGISIIQPAKNELNTVAKLVSAYCVDYMKSKLRG